MLGRRLVVKTPEQVGFSLPLAGLFTRFAAILVDFGCTLIAFYAIVVASRLLSMLLGMSLGRFGLALTQSFTMLAMFSVQWGYHILFEQIWNGQTPGKRLMRIRVARRDGGPVTFLQSFTRNLLRPIDAMPMFVPIFYAFGSLLGGVVSLIDRENRRLGDLASGTVVVRMEPWALPASIYGKREFELNSLREQTGLRRRLLLQLSKSEKSLLLEFVLRLPQLSLPVRLSLMESFSSYMEQRLDITRPVFLSHEKFVLGIADLLYAEGEKYALSRVAAKRAALAAAEDPNFHVGLPEEEDFPPSPQVAVAPGLSTGAN